MEGNDQRGPNLTPFGNFLDAFADYSHWVWPAVAICSTHGFFSADKNRCILARPVNSRVPINDLACYADLEMEYRIPAECGGGLTSDHDAWHIIYASGDLRSFFELAPYDLPKLIWQRDCKGPARIYNFSTIKRRIHHDRIKIPEAAKARSCHGCSRTGPVGPA